MTPEQKDWINELRYGGHKQGKGLLSGPNGMCCLGVAAAEVLKLPRVRLTPEDAEWADVESSEEPWVDIFDEEELNLSEAAEARLGLRGKNGRFPIGEVQNTAGKEITSLTGYNDLTCLNDTGWTFEELVDFIEANAAVIFKEEEE